MAYDKARERIASAVADAQVDGRTQITLANVPVALVRAWLNATALPSLPEPTSHWYVNSPVATKDVCDKARLCASNTGNRQKVHFHQARQDCNPRCYVEAP